MTSDLIGASSESHRKALTNPPEAAPIHFLSAICWSVSQWSKALLLYRPPFPSPVQQLVLHKTPAIAHPPAIAYFIAAPLRIVAWTCRFFISNLQSQRFFPFRVGPAPPRRNRPSPLHLRPRHPQHPRSYARQFDFTSDAQSDPACRVHLDCLCRVGRRGSRLTE